MLRVIMDADRAIRRMESIADRQIPFATARALTMTVQDVKASEDDRLDRVFDRPTPFTKRGLYISPARTSRLQSEVGFKTIQSRYLRLQETGGVRRPSGRALLLPKTVRLNRYGNMPRTASRRLRADPSVFSGKVRGVAGLWKRKRGRKAGGLQLVVAYEAKVTYRRRLNFKGVASTKARARIRPNFATAFRDALRTAR